MKFKKYESQQNEDGSHNILAVPIFSLGKHRGHNYDEDWAAKALANHQEKAAEGYLPSVIIGHNPAKEDAEEKPAVGFFDNLKLVGKNIVADLCKIPAAVYEKLKDREYPHRSIEVVPKAARITALALLGGSEPYHKLPVLEVYSQHFTADNEHERLDFYLQHTDESWDKSVLELVTLDENRNKLQRIWDVLTGKGWSIIHSDKENNIVAAKIKETLEEGIQALVPEIKQKNKEDIVAKEQFTQADLDKAAADAKVKADADFKEKYGMSPDEMAQAKLDSDKRAAEQLETARKEAITTFCNDLKEKDQGERRVLIPAVVDEIILPFMQNEAGGKVKFGEKEMEQPEAVKHVIETIVAKAAANELFADMTEQGGSNQNTEEVKDQYDDDDSIDPENLDITRKANALATKENITFQEAVMKIVTK